MLNSTLRTSEAGPPRPQSPCDEVRKVHGRGDGRGRRSRRGHGRPRARIIHRLHGPVGLGQEHVPERGGGARPADLGHRHARRHRAGAAQRAAADDPAARADRVRLSGLQPAALAHRRAEHRPAAAPRRSPRRGARRCARSRRASGLEKRLRHRPSQLSGGQQQRVAIARALVTRPEVVFADEPTGALDTRTGREVLALLRDVVDEDGHTVVMVTHDPVAAAYADRVIAARRRTRGRRRSRLPAPTTSPSSSRIWGAEPCCVSPSSAPAAASARSPAP